MRRLLLPMLGPLLALAACGGADSLPARAALAPPPSHTIPIVDPGGVNLLDTEAGTLLGRVAGGVQSRDWVFETTLTQAGTRLSAISGLGEAAWHADLERDVVARIASADGSRVALLPAGLAHVDPYNPSGRSFTNLTVVATDGGGTREYELDGNFEPEAFSSNGRSLFMVEYVPPMAPESYRVRKLDLDTGEVGPVYSVDGHLQESMRGTARVQAMTHDGSRLYTLYRTEHATHGSTAFVHVLDLDQEWAHCVDLPVPIGTSSEEQLAITVAPDGGRVVVVDALAGVAELDPESLTIARSAPIAISPSQGGRAVALLGPGGVLLAGRGTDFARFDASLVDGAHWYAPEPVVALHLDPSGSTIWSVGPNAIHAVDPERWTIVRSVAWPADVPRIEIPSPPVGDTPIQCAC